MSTPKEKQSLGLSKYHACCRSANCAQGKRKTRAKQAVAEVKKAVAEVKKEKMKLTRKVKAVIVQDKELKKAEAKAKAAARRKATAIKKKEEKAKNERAMKLYESGQLPSMVLGAVGKLPKFNKTVERKFKKSLKNLADMQKAMKNIK